MSTLDDAIHAIRIGNRAEGRRMLEEILETDETNEQIWLWLTSVVDTDEDREVCLENVLTINPRNELARKGLEALQQGRFNAQEILSEALETEPAGEGPEEGMTFLDEFQLTSQLEDDELVMPSTMAESKAKAAPAVRKKSGRGINLRLLLLVALAVVIILILGGLAAARLLLGSGEGGPTGPGEQPGQVVPAGGSEVTPVPVETPTSEPTATPTATHTPALVLPTRRPTEPPTPTATPVVPPTPR